MGRVSTTALSPAAERLLDTAGDLFCRQGIRAVGIDLILERAKVAKATLYQTFGSKEALVLAYLERRDALDRAAYRAAGHAADGPARVIGSFESAAARAERDGYLGCVYLNALTEFPDPDEPIARSVRAHREWLRAEWERAIGGVDAPRLARLVQILYDGGQVGSKVERSVQPLHDAAESARRLLS